MSDALPLVATAITMAIVCLIAVSTRLFDSWKEWKRSLPPPCAHEWDIRTKIVAAPVNMEITRGSHAPEFVVDCVERLNTGSTSVLLTCRKCGDVEERTFNGLPQEDAGLA
jgi:hypothetical protein